jgi:tripartite-type tricarboxylate transporter receptor subunit TctC
LRFLGLSQTLGNDMKLLRRQFLYFAAAAAAVSAAGRIAVAQAYPARPVRAIVPFAAGGLTDNFARLMVQKLSEHLGKQFYVENVTGASGNIGTGQAAKAAPDGYTVLFALSSFAVNPSLFARIPYDPIRDFDPVSLAVVSTALLTVNPAVPAKTIAELVSLIRANPGKYSFASAGVGTPAHLAGEQFRLSLGLDLVHVPFNGGAPALASVIAGHTQIMFASAPWQNVTEGNLRALAVTSEARSRFMPDVPTMAEAGYPDIRADSWVGILAPAGTPKEITALLNRAVINSLGEPDMRERLAALGYDVVGSTPEEFRDRVRGDIGMWAKIIRAANIAPL